MAPKQSEEQPWSTAAYGPNFTPKSIRVRALMTPPVLTIPGAPPTCHFFKPTSRVAVLNLLPSTLQGPTIFQGEGCQRAPPPKKVGAGNTHPPREGPRRLLLELSRQPESSQRMMRPR